MTSTLMIETIEVFKKEKLINYHKNLSKMTRIQAENNSQYSEFWNTVGEDSNLKKYSQNDN